MRRRTWIGRGHEIVSLVLFLLFLVSGYTMQGQQSFTVSGTVIEADSQMPLPGVSIVQKGTTNGTATDFDGNFSLTVPSDAVLVASYVGYRTEEIEVDGEEVLQIILSPDLEAMDEIVVVGYGTLKKTDLTGSVSSVSAEDLTERNLTNPLEALQGNMPGVQITTSTGRIGDGFDIVVRGKNSMSGNVEPLYIVDGVPANDIDFLNPQDIERIDVLKDASSTAIYGSRGSNGVVIVTTKSGASARPGINVSFENFVGIKEVARLPEMMDPQTWWRYHQTAYLAGASIDPETGEVSPETLRDGVSAGGNNPELFRRANDNESFDWYDAVLKSGIQQNSYLNISGTGESGVGYNLGLGYQKETGNIENESLEKYSFKAGLNHQISDKVSVGANMTVALTEQNLGSDLAMREAFRLNPFLSPYGVDGELFPLPGKLTDENGDWLINKTSTYNPILEINNSTDEIRRWNLIGNTFFQYDPIEWLSLKTSFAVGLENNRRGRSWGAMTNRGVSNNDLPSADIERLENFNYTWDNQFNINHTINEDHAFNLLGLFSMYSNRIESSFGSSRNMPFETGFYNIGSGEQSTFNVGSNFIKQTLTSYALRLNYGFLDRYLITLSNRWDGSSLLSEANRWDSFPSGAIAWRISEEAFMRNQETISNLKARLSYGFTGNNIIDPYSTINILDRQTYYDFYGTNANGWIPANIANSQLAWEKTREVNFGVDFGFFQNRVTGSVDVYDRLSDDLLLEQQLPLETGWESISANVGSVSNKGVEIALTTRNVQNQSVTWTTSFTFTKNTNSVESIYGQDEVDDIGNNLFIGESIDAHYNYRFNGIWQADEADEAASYGMEEGQAKVVDVNGDGRFTPAGDRIILGSSDPGWSGSFFSSLKVGNFDLSASVITNQDVFVFSPFHANFADVYDRGRQKMDLNWYIPENSAGLPTQYSNTYPQPRNEGPFWRDEDIGYYKDASFVKVKNIALGYNFSSDVNERLGISKLRIYGNVLNPFVFTDYEGYDPEWASAGLGIGRVSSVTYQLGFSLNF
ncbi:SusC/RagA family TonB-linked outer membrane protein [Autumnicola psychrophila]|uniref:SusC/RagA family TonB-linked outer membrane protein n=1 Tax=Autumnicola psychrophila TaxID=3075592 RepID=A0ABU3DTE3_9FLAO|nr:SusC/RagA family TonB-linked outer membrane protein [Zunongwangia sp. F225]MDT0686974.1 SusC/RagA family TonB-linked outer membrane protein [Zunongwangia sp. F225]